MIQPRHAKLQIPVELTRFVYHNGLITPFAIYLYLKLFSDGKLHQTSEVFGQMRNQLRLADNRTFKKHLGKLLELGWMGYSSKSGIYFIRSFDYLRIMLSLKKRRAATFVLQDLRHLQTYLVGVILSAKILGDKFYWELKNRGRWRTAMKKTDVASHSKTFSETPKYFGWSVKSIADYLGCKLTRASVLKNAAAKAGYIEQRHKFEYYGTLPVVDFEARKNLNAMFPKLRGMFKIVPRKINGVTQYGVFLQLHDEIIPKVKFKTIKKFNNLRVAPAIVAYANSLQRAA